MTAANVRTVLEIGEIATLGVYEVSQDATGQYTVGLDGFQRTGFSLFETLAELNVAIAMAKGRQLIKFVPKSEDETDLQKRETRSRNIALGLQRQKELNEAKNSKLKQYE